MFNIKLVNRHLVLKMICVLLCTMVTIYTQAQSYSIYVGDTQFVPSPSVAGYQNAYLTALYDFHNSNPNCLEYVVDNVYGVNVKVKNYFSGTSTISYTYSFLYTGYNNHSQIGHGSATIYVTCKPTTVKLNKTTLELELGDEAELSYSTSPSGLDPEVKWKTSDKSIATISSLDDEYYDEEEISYKKRILVCAKAVGTCTIKLGSNTGGTDPTCSVTVKNDRPYLTTDVAEGSVVKGTKVSISCDKEGADIYYTTDGTEPTKQSTKYTQPIVINESLTLKAKAYLGKYESKIMERKYSVVAHAVGDVFAYTTEEGVSLQIKAYQNDDFISLQVGTGEEGETAIDKNYTGHVTIPGSIDEMTVNVIGAYSFDGCKLSSVTIPNNFTTISKYAFRNCANLAEVDIPYASRIEAWSFENCTALRTIFIDDRWTEFLGGNAFSGCNAITRVYAYGLGISPSTHTFAVNTFPQSVYSNATLYVYKDRVSSYKSTNGWKNFVNIKTIESSKESQIQLTTSLSGYFGVTDGTRILLSSANVEDADIYYTLDGTTPSKTSTKYMQDGVPITNKCTLKAIAFKDGYEDSNILIAGSFKLRNAVNSMTKGSIKQVSAGGYHTLVVKDDGTLWACGYNYYGQLGDGTTTNSSKLKKIMDGVVSVSAGSSHSLIVKTDGSLWACGDNYYGQLGDGTTANSKNPVKIMDGVASVSAGSRHSLIVKTDGSLWACGYNLYGQLGDGTTSNSTKPKKIMDGVASASAGGEHSLVIKIDSTLWGCGVGSYIGSGNSKDKTSYIKIMNDVLKISSGYYHSLVVKKDSSLWACGYNTYGQLGTGSNGTWSSFVKISEDVISASAGLMHSLIMKCDSSLWACGRNSYGQFGNGTTIESTTPIKVMEGVKTMSSGNYHSIFIKQDGTMWASGSNTYGRLGDGTMLNSATPIMIGDGLEGPTDYEINIPASGYATFYSSESAYDLPEGLSAKVISRYNNNKLTYTSLSGNVVPKGVAVLIETATKAPNSYTLIPADSCTTYTGTNLLQGSDEATTTTGDGLHYKLSYGPSGTGWQDVFGWYWGAQNGAPFQIEGHKAWLVVPNAAKARTRGYSIDGDMLDVEEYDDGTVESVVYDLQGRKVSQPTKKGVYLRNGRKVVVK